MLTLENIESEIEKYASQAELYQYKFQLDLTGSSCNGDPNVYIKINDQSFYDEKFSGQKSFIIDHVLPKDSECKIIIGLKNKTENNTVMQDNKTDGAYYSGEWMLCLPTPIFPYLSKNFNDKIKDYNVDKTSLDADKRTELLRVVYD